MAVAHAVPRPAVAPPRPVPEASPEPQVPKVLYDEIVAERSELESQILAYNEELCALRDQRHEAVRAAHALGSLLKDGPAHEAWKRLLEILSRPPAGGS